MRLRVLQCKLVGSIVKMHRGEKSVVHWEMITAVRDYEFMRRFGQRTGDLFIISAERLTDDQIMQHAWQEDPAYEDLKEIPARSWESTWNPIAAPGTIPPSRLGTMGSGGAP
ncbi:hypothetical protein VTJ04DRAFT_1937 [Mycothermus thermophilus]|uniref:uncharacterized protein n=1 Tax=Humicola insolens TaxID=85995 RepID=UPI003742771D